MFQEFSSFEDTPNYTYFWTVPDTKGPTEVKVEGTIDSVNTTTEIWKVVQVDFLFFDSLSPKGNVVEVDEIFFFNVSSTERFRVLLEGNIFLDWTMNGEINLSTSLTTRGLHILTVEVEDDYVYQTRVDFNIVGIIINY